MTLSAGSQPRAFGAGALRFRSTSLREWLAAARRRLPGAWALPADLRTQLVFQRGEQVLSVRHDPEGDYSLVASDQALYHRDASHGWWRLGWEQVSRVSWDASAGQLLIFGVNGLASSAAAVPLSDPGPLLELAQERTTHTWLGRWHLRLAGNHSAVVELRRRPGTGEPVWAVISASDGLDSAGADATADLARAVARLGEHLGVCDP